MGERSLAQVAYETYWLTVGGEPNWDAHEDDSPTRRAWGAVVAAIAPGNDHEATEAQRFLAQKFEARCSELERDIESGRSVNAVLRTQLAEATDEAATLRGQLARAQDEARTLGESRPLWVTDGDTRRLVVWRAVQERVGVVISDAHGGATWSVDANGHSASGHCPPGQVPEQAAERAQANVEAVAGVRP